MNMIFSFSKYVPRQPCDLLNFHHVDWLMLYLHYAHYSFGFGFCWMFQSSVLVFDCVVSIKSVLLNLEGYFLGGPGFGFFGDSWFAFPAPLLSLLFCFSTFCFSYFSVFLLLCFLLFLLLCFSASPLFLILSFLLLCFLHFLFFLFLCFSAFVFL